MILSGDDTKTQSSMLIRFDRYMQQRQVHILNSICLAAESFKFKGESYLVVGQQTSHFSSSDPRANSTNLKGQLSIFRIKDEFELKCTLPLIAPAVSIASFEEKRIFMVATG